MSRYLGEDGTAGDGGILTFFIVWGVKGRRSKAGSERHEGWGADSSRLPQLSRLVNSPRASANGITSCLRPGETLLVSWGRAAALLYESNDLVSVHYIHAAFPCNEVDVLLDLA